MPKWWNYINVDYIDRLVKKFTLQDVAQRVDPFFLPRSIQPVTSVDDLFRTTKQGRTEKNLTPAAGTYVPYFTVPQGKRWTLISMWRQGSAGGTSVNITPYNGATNTEFSPYGTGSAAAGESYDGRRLRIEEYGSIGMLTTANGADGAVRFCLFYEEEDAY